MWTSCWTNSWVASKRGYLILMWRHCNVYLVECHYDAVQYDMILHTSLPSLRQNIKQFELTKDNPYLALTGELWGVFCEDFGKNWTHYNITSLYMCINTCYTVYYKMTLHESSQWSIWEIKQTFNIMPPKIAYIEFFILITARFWDLKEFCVVGLTADYWLLYRGKFTHVLLKHHWISKAVELKLP